MAQKPPENRLSNALDQVAGNVLAAPVLPALTAVLVWMMSNIGFAILGASIACLLITLCYLLRRASFQTSTAHCIAYATFSVGTLGLIVGAGIHARGSLEVEGKVILPKKSFDELIRVSSGRGPVYDVLVTLHHDLMKSKTRSFVVEFLTPTSNGEGLRILPGHAYGQPSAVLARVYPVSKPGGGPTSIAGRAWETKTVQVCLDTKAVKEFYDFNDETDRVCGTPKSILAVPVWDLREPTAKLVGILCIASSHRSPLTNSDVLLLEAYAEALSSYALNHTLSGSAG